MLAALHLVLVAYRKGVSRITRGDLGGDDCSWD
jgi:hypothetical protein